MDFGLNKEKEDGQYLINQIRERDKMAFESLYKQYYKGLYIVAYQYVNEHVIAEEIVHDVFINIWKTASQIVIEQSLKKYLFRSVVNKSLNYIKSKKKWEDKLEKYSREKNEISEDTEESEQLFTKLEDAINLLPPQCKKVMILSRFEKLKQQEIADQMGISIKTVKNHLTYGFNKMRGILGNKTKLVLLYVLAEIVHLYIIY